MPQNRRITGSDVRLAEIGRATRFKPGQSGNPGGRPRKYMISEAAVAALAEEMKDGRTKAEAVVQAIIAKALRGDVRAFEALRDTSEGRPKQAYEVKMSIMDELAERIEKPRKRARNDATEAVKTAVKGK